MLHNYVSAQMLTGSSFYISHSAGHCSGVQRGVDMAVKVKSPLAHDFRRFRRLEQSRAYPGISFGGWGVPHIQFRTEDRENVDLGGGSHLVRGFGGWCSLVQEISFHIVKFS